MTSTPRTAAATYRLGELTTHDAAESVARGDVVVLPAGAFEQHGPALPMATDLIRAEDMADRVAAAVPGRVVIGPSLPVGVSPHHLGFAGTVTLRPATFLRVAREYVDSLALHGWRRILVLTGHAGNNATLGALAQDLMHDRPDVEFAWTSIASLAGPATAQLNRAEVTGHCGESETAQMLHVAPQLVRTDRLAPGTTSLDQLDPVSRIARRTAPALARRYDELSANGVLGDPTTATADQGRVIVDTVTSALVDYVQEWLAA
ncbi:creatininase family protein [Flexivirga oryzae]|uniref:Creatinine amidohydrolase n=1 Tax=Flexivirga oryzae TaxID=1794944 RepID=A0A839N732_9MICO|nr:creatininase family protein [Flexivirga oryzae]MBB2890502.1 creatinine amidohydrolase [Flexivirga oryzae]